MQFSWRVGLALFVVAAVVVSGIHPHDRFTWFLEALPVLVGLPIAVVTARVFPLTPLLAGLLAVHSCILLLGAKYTYAEVPLGEWMRTAFGFARNHYDRIGHLAQGFVPAILIREFLLRRTQMPRGWLLPSTVASMCLAFSALYELFEAGVALVTGESAEAFLGTQGDPWDTQADMGLALLGAAIALLLLSRWHDRQLARLSA